MDDVRRLVSLVGDARLPQRTLPREGIRRFGIAEHLACAVRIARERLRVPHLELAVIGVIERRGNERIERGLFPGQAAVLQQQLGVLLRSDDHALDFVQVLQDEVVDEQLLFRADVQEGQFVVRREVRIGHRLVWPPPRERVFDLALQVQRFGRALLLGHRLRGARGGPRRHESLQEITPVHRFSLRSKGWYLPAKR